MRVMTIKELILDELNRQYAPRGIQVVVERPKPTLAVSEGNMVQLNEMQIKEPSL